MRTHLTRLLLVAIAFVVTANVFRHNFGVTPGSVSHHWQSYLVDAVAFAILNLSLGVVLRLVTLPLRILTFGLFGIVVNAILILVLSALPASTHVRLHTNAVGAFEAAIVIAAVSVLAELAGVTRKRR